MMTGFSVVYRMTAAEFAAGTGNALAGGFIEIVDANGLPTGVVYVTGVAGSQPIVVGSGSVARLAGTSIDAFNVLYDVDGVHALKASANSPSTAEQVLGLSLNAATTGQTVIIIRTGVFAGYTGFSGGPLFLGINGVVTHTPATSGVHLQVGNAIDINTSDIDIKTPIYFT